MKKIIIPGLFAGLAILITGFIISQLFMLIFPSIRSQYNNSAIIRSWADPFISLYFIVPFLSGILLSWAWHHLKELIHHNKYGKGLVFGFIYWITTIPGMLMSLSTFQLSFVVIFSWIVALFCQGLVAGYILEKLDEHPKFVNFLD